MLGTIINNIGLYGAMTYYNIKLGSIKEKKDIIRYTISMIIFFIFTMIFIEYIQPISEAISFIGAVCIYLLVMKILSKRNLFFSLFEFIYSLIITLLAQGVFILLCLMPMHITLEQFEQSIIWKAVFSIFNVVTYFIVSKIVGRQLFKYRWNCQEKCSHINSLNFL